jgi:hypothetical protein
MELPPYVSCRGYCIINYLIYFFFLGVISNIFVYSEKLIGLEKNKNTLKTDRKPTYVVKKKY